jgi:hypothetical protein
MLQDCRSNCPGRAAQSSALLGNTACDKPATTLFSGNTHCPRVNPP